MQTPTCNFSHFQSDHKRRGKRYNLQMLYPAWVGQVYCTHIPDLQCKKIVLIGHSGIE